MVNNTQSSMSSSIVINGNTISVIEYHDQHVVTLGMIDELHQRAEGTARKRFNDNRMRFVEGEDFWEVRQASEIRTLGFARTNGSTPAKIVLLAESGYLMLVKSFTDDLAWQIQRELVNGYFRRKSTSSLHRKRRPAFDIAFRRCLNVAGLIPHLDQNQKILMAARGTHNMTGINPLEAMGMAAFPSPDNINYQTPTQLGKVLGLSAIRVNRLLQDKGLQNHTPGASTGSDWTMTPKGLAYGRLFDTTRTNAKGSQQQLKWKHEVLILLQMEEVAA